MLPRRTELSLSLLASRALGNPNCPLRKYSSAGVNENAAFDPYRGPELMPGAAVRSDAEIDAWVRKTAETIYHAVGSARMGKDTDSVVDATLKVYGVEGLRVVDASVMPTLVSGNTNAPTMMIAEKASDMILGRTSLPPEHVPVAEDHAVAAE